MNRDTFKARRPRVIEITLNDGEKVHAKKLSQTQVETIQKQYSGPGKGAEGYRYVVTKCLSDADGNRILEDGDLKALEELPHEDIEKIAVEVINNSKSKSDDGSAPNA